MQIVDEARAIVLAGGTLQPTSELRERLFPQVSGSTITSSRNGATLSYRQIGLIQYHRLYVELRLCWVGLLPGGHVGLLWGVDGGSEAGACELWV